jgi:hypothetical protein
METQLFTWEDFDPIDEQCYQFTRCKLWVPIGRHCAGDKIPLIEMDFEAGTMTLYPTDEGIAGEMFELRLGIGERL